ncbi:hypothetical protein ACISMR_08495, partial [Campylobacter jejuni]
EQDKNANTQELENKINSLVYKLYNLTEEEINFHQLSNISQTKIQLLKILYFM